MERKDWTRIGVAAAVLLVPGGFVLGGLLAAQRYRAARGAKAVEPLGDGDDSAGRA